MARRAIYPGTFNPPTVAHLAVASAARAQCGVDVVAWTVSHDPIGKPEPKGPGLEGRVKVLEAVADRIDWLEIAVTRHRLIASMADGYDVVIMGTDKWNQVVDPSYYDDIAARDRAVARLPVVALAPRAGLDLAAPLPAGAVVLDVPAEARAVSSTAARAGRRELMLPEARQLDEATGCWTGRP